MAERALSQRALAKEMNLSEGIVLGPEVSKHFADKPLSVRQIEALDELHLRKIDIANRVLVLNVGGYIGKSTRREIRYAKSTGTLVTYLEETKAADSLSPAT